MMLNIIFTFQAESQWNYFVISKLAQVQTSHFTSAKSNANEQGLTCNKLKLVKKQA